MPKWMTAGCLLLSARLEDKHGLIVRFVVGHSDDAEREERMQKEMLLHGDFLQLDVSVCACGCMFIHRT